MTFEQFHNALRILLCIDRRELEQIGVIEGPSDNEEWDAFRRDPFRWFIRADDETAGKVWRLIQKRQ
jgi:hypothetical protein